MAGTISAFFQSLFSTTRAPEPQAPTRLVSESRAVNDMQGPSSVNPHHKPSLSSAYKQEAPMSTTSANTKNNGDNESGSRPNDASEANPDEIRRLRAQFLDNRFGAQGKRGGRNGRAKATS
ncbi:hypothetical protein PG989_008861 [Apiospora arundinis]